MNRTAHLPDYVELNAVSNYSFLRGGSHPEELIERALALGYRGLALTDEASLAGVVRAHLALRKAREAGVPGAATFQLLLGSEFEVNDPVPFKLVVLACHRIGYGLLCEFITRLRRANPGKGLAPLRREDIHPAAWGDCLVLLIPQRHTPPEAISAHTRWLRQHFADRCWLGVALHHHLDDAVWLRTLRHIGEAEQVPLVATGDVHMHLRSRKPLQDVLTATRVGLALAGCGLHLDRHAERHLRSRLRLAQRYPADLLRATQDVAARCAFSLDELRYEYPDEIVPQGESADGFLRRVSAEGLARRYPQGVSATVQAQLNKELALIAELGYEKYFLTVYDIVCFARSRHILC
ncbi:MAG: PHP domain-containing protein, partial [Aquabacterium sp.]|nr:PHP domain-containing protein [Aquabacterium sp.]